MNRLFSILLTAPLLLTMAACDTAETGDSATTGEAIAAIPAPTGQLWATTTAISEENGYIIGNPDAPIKLLEYASHTCGACAAFSQAAAEPMLKYVETGVVSFELRNLVRDPIDVTIARLVRCGSPETMQPLAKQAWGAFDQIMTAAQQNAEVLQTAASQQNFVQVADAAGLMEFFAARGISRDQASACLADTASITAIVDRSQAQADELGIDSTPTFFINGQKLEERSWEEVEAALQRAGAR